MPVATTNGSAIEAVNLAKRYGELVAVDRASFSVRRGEASGFLGPNGAGKPVVSSEMEERNGIQLRYLQLFRRQPATTVPCLG